MAVWKRLYNTLYIGVLLVALFWVFVLTKAILEGPTKCSHEIGERFPALIDQSIEVERIWTRTLDNHWVTAIVYAPESSQDGGVVTVVCHFKEKSFVFDQMEKWKGNQLDKIKRLSRTNYDPRTWF